MKCKVVQRYMYLKTAQQIQECRSVRIQPFKLGMPCDVDESFKGKNKILMCGPFWRDAFLL